MSYYNKDIQKAISKLSTHGKTLFLAQDQGLQHGTADLIGDARDPEFVFNVAEKGEIDAFICQKGLAEKYGASYKTNIVLKVNGNSNLRPLKEPYSPVTCSVRRAVDLNAKCIGFTAYPGSDWTDRWMNDFRDLQEEAHDFGLPFTAWMYPRGKAVKNPDATKTLHDCARIGLELGADMLKMHYNGDKEAMREQVRYAGAAKMLMSGGPKANSTKDFLKQIDEVNSVGAHGFAIGRNIWQHNNPIGVSKAIRDVQIRGKDVYTALKRL